MLAKFTYRLSCDKCEQSPLCSDLSGEKICKATRGEGGVNFSKIVKISNRAWDTRRFFRSGEPIKKFVENVESALTPKTSSDIFFWKEW